LAENRNGALARISRLARTDWLLAIESATGPASAALWRDGETRDAEAAAPEDSAAAGLLPAIDRLLRRAGLEAGQLAAHAIAIGPGSFTGLRIGVATLKGLAFGSAAPVAAVSTLAALARGAGPGADPVVAVLDARRGEVYAGAFQRAGEQADPCLPEGVYTPEELIARLPADCRLSGDGAPLVHEVLQAALGPRIGLARESALRAGPVAELGALLLAQGAGVPAEALVPRYLRRAEAEARRTGQRFEAL
jgi:tRNA threonylcarbamoyladenosine biosynthesis protein TsaB